MAEAFVAYRTDVEQRTFPAPEHTVEMSDEAWQAFVEAKDGKGDGPPRK
jgi:hypothetical protein